jgi:hypothetical protein
MCVLITDCNQCSWTERCVHGIQVGLKAVYVAHVDQQTLVTTWNVL